MPRICYWNIAKVGDGSPPEKMEAIITALRNFWLFWPTYYLFSEVSRAWLSNHAAMTQLAGGVLAGHWLASPTGYTYCVIDPHVVSAYSPETASEGAAIVIPNNVQHGPPIEDRALLAIWNPTVEVENDAGRVSRETLPGVRRPVRFDRCALGVEIYIHHPSPTGRHMSFKTLVKAVQQEYRADPTRKLLVVGDFNVQADATIPFTGMTAPQYAHNCGLVLAPPDHDTHDEGKIDYVIHTPNITVGQVTRLDRDRAASDHYPIWFDYST